MRRYLNLNGPSRVFLKMIALFIFGIPAVLYGILLVLNNAALTGVLLGILRISIAIGVLGIVILLALVVAEQIQDYRFDIQYQKNRAQKLSLNNGGHECQYCGSRAVKENDHACPVCGKELK